MKTIKIAHLYPNLMNLYGDYANIVVLKKHLEDQGLKVRVDYLELNKRIDLSLYDFIYMGSGTENNLKVVLADFGKYKKDLSKCIKDNKVILFTGNAISLLGNKIDNKKALGVFDFDTVVSDKRYTGDVVLHNEDIGEVVGFINTSLIIDNKDKHNLFEYIFKDRNLKTNKTEGYHLNNLFATSVIGPVLVKNPCFMNVIVKKLLPLKNKYKEVQYKYEEDSYRITLEALLERNR